MDAVASGGERERGACCGFMWEAQKREGCGGGIGEVVAGSLRIIWTPRCQPGDGMDAKLRHFWRVWDRTCVVLERVDVVEAACGAGLHG